MFHERGLPSLAPLYCRGSGGILPWKILYISSPRKRDFRHSEAKSACLDISFFLHQNITKTCVTMMQICIYKKTMRKIYCLNFIFFSILCFVKDGMEKTFKLY